jgi:hypothetical protein
MSKHRHSRTKPAQIGWNVLLFRVAERPNLIALDSLARQVAQVFILIFRACLSNLCQQLNNGIFRHSVILTVARIEFPSTSAEITAICRSIWRLFMSKGCTTAQA